LLSKATINDHNEDGSECWPLTGAEETKLDVPDKKNTRRLLHLVNENEDQCRSRYGK